MTVRERFDAERNVLRVVLEGTVTDEDLLAYAQGSAGSPDVPEGHDVLVDLRGADPASIGSHALRRVADLFTRSDRTPERCRIAMVASHDAGYGLSRMYQAFRSDSPIEVRVFRDMDGAHAWLGLPDE